MSDYRMTKEQKAFLDSLVCQRISDDKANKAVIQAFENPNSSSGITGALKRGWTADSEDRVAYYIIKDPADNQPLLFFSLKCGEVHQPLDPEKLNKSVDNALMLLQAAVSRCGQPYPPNSPDPGKKTQLLFLAMDALREAEKLEVEDWAKEVVEKQLMDERLPIAVWDDIWYRVFRSQYNLVSYEDEMKLEHDNIIRTKKTFAAVELVHFCAHAPAKEKWKTLNMGQSLGKTLFWHFIEPKIRELRELVGCEYLYLFAADGDRDGKLCGLYQELGFDFRDEIYVTKPAYDFCCYFMCQEVRKLRTRKKEFLKAYNKPKEPAAV